MPLNFLNVQFLENGEGKDVENKTEIKGSNFRTSDLKRGRPVFKFCSGKIVKKGQSVGRHYFNYLEISCNFRSQLQLEFFQRVTSLIML